MSSRLLNRAQSSAVSKAEPLDRRTEFQTFPSFPEVVCAKPAGRLDPSALESLNDEILKAIQSPATNLLFDFSCVEDMDSASVGFLIALQKRLRQGGGDLVLCAMRPRLKRVLEVVGFGEFFSTALDMRYALEYIEKARRDRFPVSAVCPACSSPIGIDSPGRGRCRACNAVLTAFPDGSIEAG